MQIVPVILAGGAGARLRSVSPVAAKQFLPLLSDRPMLQDTVARVTDADVFHPPIITAHVADNGRIIAAAAGITVTSFIHEPTRRNTAPAIILATLVAQAHYGDDVFVLTLPCDHWISDTKNFQNLIQASAAALPHDAILAIGIKPDHPSTDYGYIQAKGSAPLRPITEFIEKPDIEKATHLYQRRNIFWNAGIYMARAGTLIAQTARHAPDILCHAEKSLIHARRAGKDIYSDAASFHAMPAVPFDTAIMEKTSDGMMGEANFSWADIGTPESLAITQTHIKRAAQ